MPRGLNENHLICIFMNINENEENQDLQRENNYIAIWRVWFGLMDVIWTLRTNAQGCQFGQRITLMPICVT